MRLRWILIPLGILVAVAAVAYYLLWVPPMLANDYEEKAKPAHVKVEDALRPVTESFHFHTFGSTAVSRVGSLREYIRELDSVTARDLRELAVVRRHVRKATKRVERAERGPMTDDPGLPLLGITGDVSDAQEVADREREYLRKARDFLAGYDELLAYTAERIRLVERVNVLFARVELGIGPAPGSPGEFSGPLERGAREATSLLKRFERLRPPADTRMIHRHDLRDLRFFISRQRAIAKAVTRGDAARADELGREIDDVNRRAEREGTEDLDRLTKRSTYRRQIDDLERRETAIAKLYEEL